jgi:hypothetical protein
MWLDEDNLMGAFLHFHVCWVESQDFLDQFPTHSVDLAADIDGIVLEGMRLAVMVTVTG